MVTLVLLIVTLVLLMITLLGIGWLWVCERLLPSRDVLMVVSRRLWSVRQFLLGSLQTYPLHPLLSQRETGIKSSGSLVGHVYTEA